MKEKQFFRPVQITRTVIKYLFFQIDKLLHRWKKYLVLLIMITAILHFYFSLKPIVDYPDPVDSTEIDINHPLDKVVDYNAISKNIEAAQRGVDNSLDEAKAKIDSLEYLLLVFDSFYQSANDSIQLISELRRTYKRIYRKNATYIFTASATEFDYQMTDLLVIEKIEYKTELNINQLDSVLEKNLGGVLSREYFGTLLYSIFDDRRHEGLVKTSIFPSFGLKFELLIVYLLGYFFSVFIALNYRKIASLSSQEQELLDESELGEEDDIYSNDFNDISIMLYDLKKTEKRSIQLYNRSTFMLVGGLIMSILGVIVFVSYSTYSDNPETWLDYVSRFGILVFIESIAWFLLKQYRVLINDYKEFNGQFKNRLNQIAAAKLFEKSKISDAQLMMGTTLLQSHDFSKLKNGESTKGIEESKNFGVNPAAELFKLIIDAKKGE